ncbi:hypothetical protein RF11_04118 [Thelohanellus kitauei]|uniref:Uncharacterized protein n=1 Tax=Thelohanellus kitauei TaxID=669202 RepID=A0A0C2MN95_THEKT|nr:hypothetical protein RF11_04118 [Thelohanellus kitauei]
MISWVLFFTGIPRFMGYKASKYDIEACYKIMKPGETVLVGFRFPAFNSIYPPFLYMTIEQINRKRHFRNISKDIRKFQLIFHSVKCSKTMEISNSLIDSYISVSFRL